VRGVLCAGLVWLAGLALVVSVWWEHRLVSMAWFARRSVTQLTVMIGLATALVSGSAAFRLTGTVLFPAGDEPHFEGGEIWHVMDS